MEPNPSELSTVQFYNVFSVFMTREMLPVLSKEHQRQKIVVELLNLSTSDLRQCLIFFLVQEKEYAKATALVAESPQV